MLFASVGYEVSMFDVQQGKVDEALKDIEEQLQRLESSGRLRGNLNAAKQLKLIKKSNSLEECLKGSIHCQVNHNLEGNQFFNYICFLNRSVYLKILI